MHWPAVARRSYKLTDKIEIYLSELQKSELDNPIEGLSTEQQSAFWNMLD